MSILLCPIGGNGQAFVDANGNPRSGAKLFIYAAGTSTKSTVYQDAAGSTQHANPIVLNSSGQVANGSATVKPIFLTSGATYDLVLAPSNDTDPPVSPYFTLSSIPLVNDATTTLDQWVLGGGPTYVSATSLTLAGDVTSTYHVGRRIKTTNSGGTIYSTITQSTYTTLTTLTVVNDSGTLDSGLSAIYYGFTSAQNTSVGNVLPISVAGDLIYMSSPYISSRLAIGTKNQFPTVNASANGYFWTGGVNSKTDNYSLAAADHGKWISMNGASKTLTLLSAATAGNGFWTAVTNEHSSSLIVGGGGTNIIGPGFSTNQLTLSTKDYMVLYSSGSFWYIFAHHISFTSSLITVPATGNAAAAHGFPIQPKQWSTSLQCTSTDLGYSVGDEISCETLISQTGGHGIIGYVDATSIGISTAAITSITITNKTAGGFAGMDLTTPKWKAIFRARL